MSKGENMKHIIKSISLLLVIFLIGAQFGCSQNNTSSASSSLTSSETKNEEETTNLVEGKFAVPYSQTTNMNPLTTTSQLNKEIWPLIYDSLCEPDSNYIPQMKLAESIDINGLTVTVTLKSSVKFHDGSTLTASDVKASLDYVKATPTSPYNSRLSNVSSIEVAGNTVLIQLNSPDPNFANLLDIPIIKASEDPTQPAVGSGRYIYTQNGVDANLSVFEDWYGKKVPILKTIILRNIPYNDAIITSLSTRNINFVYSDFGTGSLGSATNTQISDVNLNQLIYIGLNTTKDRLNNSSFRKALSYSLDRTGLSTQVYSNHALPTVLPFNPEWDKLSKIEKPNYSADHSKSQEEMATAGGSGTKTEFTLIVNSENAIRVSAANFIADNFSKAGVNVVVKSLSFADYQAAINSSNFDMYIGEYKISNNMDINSFLVAGGATSAGVPANSKTLSAFNAYKNSQKSIEDVATTFSDEMPFIPVCYHLGTVSYTNGLSGVKSTDSNIFYDIDSWGYEESAK